MRISDWSSDVCSSDLLETAALFLQRALMVAGRVAGAVEQRAERTHQQDDEHQRQEARHERPPPCRMFIHEKPVRHRQIGRASCRERVCQDVSISVVAVSLKKKTERTNIIIQNT